LTLKPAISAGFSFARKTYWRVLTAKNAHMVPKKEIEKMYPSVCYIQHSADVPLGFVNLCTGLQI
jgi:hypothetical protein